MVNVKTQIEILSPINKVSEFAMNPDNAPKWYVNIKSAEWLTQKPLSVGTKVAFKADFLGKKLSYTYAFTEVIPNAKLVMQTDEGPFPMKTTYIFEAVNQSETRMTLINKGEPTGFSKIFTPIMSFMMKRANNKDLLKIKSILENNNK